MPRKPKTPPKTPPAPAPAPPDHPKRSRQRLPAKDRMVEAAKTLALGSIGHDALTEAMGVVSGYLLGLPDDWAPKREAAGPLQRDDYAEPMPALRGAEWHRHHCPPYRITALYQRGRSRLCTVVDQDGTMVANVLVSELRRCAPPVAVPDVPLVDPAGDDEPSLGDVVLT